MIELSQAGEEAKKFQHEGTLRKQKQLEEAEKEHDRLVQEEEAEELAKQKKQEEAAEQAALEAARNSPSAKLMEAANDAASSINVDQMEANIQA